MKKSTFGWCLVLAGSLQVAAAAVPVVDVYSQNRGPNTIPRQVLVRGPNADAQYSSETSSQRFMSSREGSQFLKRLADLQEAVQQLRGQLEIQSHDLMKLREQQRALYQDLDQRVSRLGAKGKLAVLPTSTANLPDPHRQVQAPTALPEAPVVAKQEATVLDARERLKEQMVYEAAYKEIRGKNYSQAMIDLREFVKQYPASEYAPNAHYWIGELYLLGGDTPRAISEFNAVVKRYSGSAKAADAMLKLGFIYYDQGQWQPARQQLSQVVQAYPNTGPAQLAQNRINEMEKAGH